MVARKPKKPLDHHHEWELADSDRILQDMQRSVDLMKGRSGSASQNLDNMAADVRQTLRERGVKREMAMNTYGTMGTAQMNQYQVPVYTQAAYQQPQSFAMIQDQNTERLFKPLIPMNRYIHADDHLEWLKGRTRSVCSRVKWSKTAQTY